MHEFDAAQQNACTPECLEAEHGSSASFDCPVILFDGVIQILVLAILIGVLRWAFSASSAARFEPLLSIVIVSGSPF
jgi:hypothetical protein